MGATTILAGPAFQLPGGGDPARECLIFNPMHNVEVANLGLSANGNMAGTVQSVVYVRESTDIRFSRVRIEAHGYNPADINGSHRVSFFGCLFIGKDVFMGNSSQSSFDACRFLMTDDSVSALHTWGGQQLSLTRNLVQNFRPFNEYDGSGWGLGRFLCGNDIWGSGADIYLGGNRTIGLGVRAGYWDQNNGEQVLWEGTLTLFDGQVASATSDSVTLDNYTDTTVLDHEFAVSIVGGKGIGQTRTISSNAGATIALTQPWNVVPDATSRIVVETLPHNIAVYGNFFSGRPKMYQNAADNASTGVQLFEGGADIIVDRNAFRMVRTDVALWGGSNNGMGASHVNPMMFSYVANNLFVQSRNSVRWCRQTSDAGVLFVGNVLRSNRNFGTLTSAVWVITASDWATLPDVPVINLVESTLAGGAAGNVYLDGPSQDAGGVLMI